MSFEMRMRFNLGFVPKDLASFDEELGRLTRQGWNVPAWNPRPFSSPPFILIDRTIRQLYLAEVHWGQRFLGLEPTEISVVFQNSLFPLCHGNSRFFDTKNRWVRSESEMFPGCYYRTRTNVTEKTLEIQVSGGQQLGRENWKKFLVWLGLYLAVTKITRELHQFRMAAGKQNVPEMDRHYNEILETLGDLSQ